MHIYSIYITSKTQGHRATTLDFLIVLFDFVLRIILIVHPWNKQLTCFEHPV